jgi:hypothetical protein
VALTSKLGPVVSGPKHQILRALAASQEYWLTRRSARRKWSWSDLTFLVSIASVSSCPSGCAFAHSRLNRLVDFESATLEDSVRMVSR